MPQKEGLSGTELIRKLETISGLYHRAKGIQYKMDHFEPEDNYERTVNIPIFPGNYKDEAERTAWERSIDHEANQAIDVAAAVYKRAYEPKKPQKPTFGTCPTNENKYATENKQKLGCLPIVAGFIAVCSLISGGLFAGDSGTVIGNIVILIACAAVAAFFFLRSSKAKQADEEATRTAIEAYERDKSEKEAKYAQDMQSYQAAMNDFNEESRAFVRAYTEWRGIYLESRREEEDIAEKLEEDRQAAVNAINKEEMLPVLQELSDTNDLVSMNYLPVLETLIDLLKDGRADDLKEAINLYEDIVYRERQLELEREKEEQRRWEEEQRRRDEERHHKEQMKFQQDQERQRQREEERRQQDAERRHREEMDQRDRQERDRQNEERRRADEERRRAERAELDRKQKEDRETRDQCNRCAQAGHCSMAFRRPNCASFRPR